MPKRRAEEEEIEYYRAKLRKLQGERKRNHRRIRVIDSDSTDENEGPEVTTLATEAEIHNAPDAVLEPVASPDDEHLHISTTDQPEITPAVQSTNEQMDNSNQEPELDPELLRALGEGVDDTPEYGDKIHENLPKIWLPILKKGLTKENKEKLVKDYLIPENCRLFQAPKLNAEIYDAVPDMVRNRDKNLMTQQQQLGSGVTAVNRGIDILLKGDDKKQAIQHLSNGCRILSDLHAYFTQNRVKLLTQSLDKNVLHIIQDTERDETLFGDKLSEKIKAAKTIARQGQQIKKAANPRPSSSFQPHATRGSNAGNWTAPPRQNSYRGSRGGSKRTSYQPYHSRRSYQSANATTSAQSAANKSSSASRPRAPTTQ